MEGIQKIEEFSKLFTGTRPDDKYIIYESSPCVNVWFNAMEVMQYMQCNWFNAIDSMQLMQCNAMQCINAMQWMQCSGCSAIEVT